MEYNITGGVLTFQGNPSIIESESFAEREDLLEIVFPSTVTVIGGAAFAGCENLKKVTWEDPCCLESVDDGAFTLCHSLTQMVFPDSLKQIGEMAFWETGLVKVVLKNVSEIGDSAFWNCENLREFHLLNPECVLGRNILGECEHLQEGFVAPGFPTVRDEKAYHQIDLLEYSLLWLTHPQGHLDSTRQKAEKFIRSQEIVVMEKILERNNTAALTGMVQMNLLDLGNISGYLEQALAKKRTEISHLLLEARGSIAKDRWEDLNL